MVDGYTLAALVVGVIAVVLAVIFGLPAILQWRIDRNPKRHYRYEGPDHGWLDMGDVGRPQLSLTIWNDRSVPVDFGVQAMDVRPENGGGGVHLFDQRIAVGHSTGALQPLDQIEVPAHGHRRLAILGRTPVTGYRGDLGVAVTDGDRRDFLIYHHRADDGPPIEGAAERNAVPPGAFPYASGTFAGNRTVKINDKGVYISAKGRS